MRSTSVSRCSPVCSQKSEKRPKVTHSLGRRAWEKYEHPGGNVEMVLLRFRQETSDKIWTYWRGRFFPHSSESRMPFSDVAPVFPRYSITLKTKDSPSLHLR